MLPWLSVMNFVTSEVMPCWSGQCRSSIAVGLIFYCLVKYSAKVRLFPHFTLYYYIIMEKTPDFTSFAHDKKPAKRQYNRLPDYGYDLLSDNRFGIMNSKLRNNIRKLFEMCMLKFVRFVNKIFLNDFSPFVYIIKLAFFFEKVKKNLELS